MTSLDPETAARAVRALLRPSEILTGLLLAQNERVDALNAFVAYTITENDRVLAVVQNQDGLGGVLLLRPSPSPSRSPHTFLVAHAFAITPNLSINIAQAETPVRRKTLPLSPGSSTSSYFVLTLKGSNGKGDEESVSLRVRSSDLPKVRIVMDQCKAHAAKSPAHKEGKYTWIQTYASQAPHLLALPLRPPVPTLPSTPIHETLSLLHAGMHRPDADDTDEADLVLIARECARRTVLNGTGCTRGKRRLRVRIGTFNVNGKLPSEDLACWVKGVRSTQSSSVAEASETASVVSKVSDITLVDGAPTNTAQRRQTTPSSLPSLTIPISTSPKSELTSDSSGQLQTDPPHVIVLGFQELDLSTEALIYSSTATREDAWTDAIFSALGAEANVNRDEYERAEVGRAEYEKVASKQLVGMLLMVFARRELLIKGEITRSSVKTTAIGTGIMGLMGNKGAVAIRLTITPSTPPLPSSPLSPISPTTPTTPTTAATVTRKGTHPLTLTFINSHLAAFDEQTSKRNAEFWDLSRRLVFGEGSYAHMPESPSVSKTVAMGDGADALFTSDAVFWMGDLNYRVDLPDGDVRRLLAPPAFPAHTKQMRTLDNDALLRFDQLKNAKWTNAAFGCFEEGNITRLPTYRFAHGQLTDPLGYDLKRRPAWTDRILYMASGDAAGVGVSVHQTDYDGHPDILMSDHRPVSANFVLEIPDIDLKKYEDGVRELYHQLGDFRGLNLRTNGDSPSGANAEGKSGSDMIPKIRVGKRAVDFDKLELGKRVVRTLDLQNVGVIACGFRFMAATEGGPIHPDWLTVEPMTGMILPNNAVTVTLTAYVDTPSAAILNLTPSKLRDTLIVHTQRGRDHFVELIGEFQKTCFGTTLAHLTRLPGPIRPLGEKELLSESQAVNAPREIVRLVNWLMTHATSSDELFVNHGHHYLVDQIRESLDTGEEFPSFSDHSSSDVALAFGTTLLELLDALTEPVIPYAVQERCAQATSRDEAFEILEDLPMASVNVWISVTAFLHYISQQPPAMAALKDDIPRPSPVERATLLAAIFAPVLLKDPSPIPLSSRGASSEKPPSTPTMGMWAPILPTVSPVAKRDFLLYFIS